MSRTPVIWQRPPGFSGWHDRTHCPVCNRSMTLRPDGKLVHHKPPNLDRPHRNEPLTGADWCPASHTRPSTWYLDDE